MIYTRIYTAILAAAFSALLAGCGGGGDPLCKSTTFAMHEWRPSQDEPRAALLAAYFSNTTDMPTGITVRITGSHVLSGSSAVQIATYGTISTGDAPATATTEATISDMAPSSFNSSFSWSYEVPAGVTVRVSLVAAIIGTPETDTTLFTTAAEVSFCQR